MNFMVDPAPPGIRPRIVRYISESISIAVGEISFEKGAWMFHHHSTTAGLTEAGQAEMKTFVSETITLIQVTQRMTK